MNNPSDTPAPQQDKKPLDRPSSTQERSEPALRGGGLGNFLRGLFRIRPEDGGLRETLEDLLDERDGSDESPFDADEILLITNILRLRKTTAEDVMIPRAEVISIAVDTPIAQALELFANSGHSRLPVYRETLDTPLGMVHVKDVIALASIALDQTIEKAVREVLYISPSARIFDLIRDMRQRRIHMALVVDEYGGIDGLVTIEDLIEEIVGDIEDEHDREETPELIVRDDGSIEVDARMELEDFEERFGPVFTDEERDEIDTLGGLVFRLAGRVPTRGEIFHRENGRDFEVLEASPRSVRRLRITGLTGAPSGTP